MKYSRIVLFTAGIVILYLALCTTGCSTFHDKTKDNPYRHKDANGDWWCTYSEPNRSWTDPCPDQKTKKHWVCVIKNNTLDISSILDSLPKKDAGNAKFSTAYESGSEGWHNDPVYSLCYQTKEE